MSMVSPSPESVSSLIFWAGSDADGEFERPELNELSQRVDFDGANHAQGTGEKRDSLYVRLFEDMLATVLDKEQHLVVEDEWNCIDCYSRMSYSARYLLIRLCLRKENKWHRLDQLKYQHEIGNKNKIIKAIRELCYGTEDDVKAQQMEVKEEEREIIDLTLDDDDEPPAMALKVKKAPVAEEKPQPGPSKSLPAIPTNSDPLLVFAEDESQMTLLELLDCLSLDELKKLGKQMKLKVNLNRSSLIAALLNTSSTQSTLNFPIVSSRSRSKKLKQTKLAFASTKARTQQTRLRTMAITLLGKCVRVNNALIKFFQRINLVYFRNTQHSPTLLIPSILSCANKRSYPAYTYQRRNDIWLSRKALIEYEEALALEARVDGILESVGTGVVRARSWSVASKTPARQTRTTSASTGNVKISVKGKEKENLLLDDDELAMAMNQDDDMITESPRMQNARLVKEILEVAFPRWKDLVQTKGQEGGRPSGLERFDCGHVYTRIVCKGASALGILKEYKYELEVLDTLLAQKRWRRGRRGKWHDRRALILMTYFPKDDMEVASQAMQGVIDALLDDDTHIIYRPMLQRRLTRLEKKLGIRMEDRHTSAGQLLKAEETTITGIRIPQWASSLHLDNTGRPVNKLTDSFQVKADTSVSRDSPALKSTTVPPKENGKEMWKGKSVWRGRDEDKVSVEILALQHYETIGFKGFHSEGRIVCTLFGLLFWDILFADIPGAFETEYQSAPLDIAEDCFYYAREGLIKERLAEIEQGKARQILEKIDEEHRAKGTLCVGVRWDLFTKQDLLEIVDCLGGTSLSVICHLFCEDYSGRGGGVPDLIIWNAQQRECRFVEVKGPGDTLQENQKIWIDVLLRAGTTVELCHVVEHGQSVKKSTRKVASNSRKGKGKTKMTAMNSDSDSEQVFVESEDELGASPSDWKINIDPNPGKVLVDEDELPRFTMNTRARSATIATTTKTEGSIDADKKPQLDFLLGDSQTEVIQQPHGKKRKAEHSPQTLSHSSSQQIVEVLIMVPSPKRKRIIQASHVSSSTA